MALSAWPGWMLTANCVFSAAARSSGVPQFLTAKEELGNKWFIEMGEGAIHQISQRTKSSLGSEETVGHLVLGDSVTCTHRMGFGHNTGKS